VISSKIVLEMTRLVSVCCTV